MTESIKPSRLFRRRRSSCQNQSDVRIEEIPRTTNRPLSLFLTIGHHGIAEYQPPCPDDHFSEASSSEVDDDDDDDEEGEVMTDVEAAIPTPASHLVALTRDPADPFHGAKPISFDRHRRPWTIMVPRNEAQERQQRHSSRGGEEGRRSLRLLNTKDDQVLDIEGGEAFLETLRQHLEGKRDSSLIILDDDLATGEKKN